MRVNTMKNIGRSAMSAFLAYYCYFDEIEAGL
jgi:hypothetical protein